MATEQLIAIANKLYECRRNLRRIMGDRYYPDIVPYMEGVRRCAVANGIDDMQACLRLSKEFTADGMDVCAIWAMAAAVELIEPDELTPKLQRVT